MRVQDIGKRLVNRGAGAAALDSGIWDLSRGSGRRHFEKVRDYTPVTNLSSIPPVFVGYRKTTQFLSSNAGRDRTHSRRPKSLRRGLVS